jgi:MscS family membrane protein
MLETINTTASNATDSMSGSIMDIRPMADGLESWIALHMGLGAAISDLLTAAIILAIFVIISQLAKHFVTDVMPHMVAKTESTLDDEILTAIKGPIQVLIIVIGAYLASKTLNEMPSVISGLLDRLTTIALILVGAYFISNLISAIIRWYVHDIAPKTDSDLDDHLMPFLQKFMVAAVYVVALVMIIGLFTPITPLIAGLGVFGIAIALAAKEMLSNLFGAVAILTDRPYKLGDRLLINGIGMGDVTEIGMRSTRIVTADNRIVVIPNEMMANSRIVNVSQPDAKVRVTLKVGVGYGSDIDRACAIMEKSAVETQAVSIDPRPRAYVSQLSDFSVEITLLVWIDSYMEDLRTPDLIYRNILSHFKEEGIDIPYPIMTVMPKKP